MTGARQADTTAKERQRIGGVASSLTVGILGVDFQKPTFLETVCELVLTGPLDIVITGSGAPDPSVLDAAQQRLGSSVELRWLGWEPGTSALNTLFALARTDWVLCLQSGAQLHPTALGQLEKFIATNPDYQGLVQGPKSSGPRHRAFTHLEPVWCDGHFGVPARDPRISRASMEPFEVGMQDPGVFACRKDRWPGIDPKLGIGTGPPGYLHKKFRAQAGRTLCLPSLRWSVAGHDPAPPNWGTERLFNYLLCWEDTGQAIEPLLEHYIEGQGSAWVDHYLAHWQASRNNPFDAFDAIVCINSDHQPERWSRMTARFAALGIAEKIQRLPAVRTSERYQLGCALSHRNAVAMARERGLESILVFEDDAVFLNGATWVLRHSVRELLETSWKLFYLGGFYLNKPDALHADRPASGAGFLRHAPGLVTTHAIAYHESVFDQILGALPATPEAMHEFLADFDGNIDVYYAETFHDGVYRCAPTIASQESLIRQEDPDLRDQFFLDSPNDETSHVARP
ncbi:glycosyltransferase family 25 protein [Nocardia brasiliensis]|uniref:glycosyltransferase family 25 protein n=1 Tax=Nocardia brasiliensis TaxID=37326 RepID=UPI003D94941E